MKTDWHDLIQRHLAGHTTEEEAAHFQDALMHDDAVARLYLRYTNLDVALESHAESDLAVRELLLNPVHSPTKPSFMGFPWRPCAAAAAGIVFGIFGASMVWAYTDRTAERTYFTLTEGFEKTEQIPTRGFPRGANEWAGDLSLPVTAESGVVPVEGNRMVRLENGSSNSRRFSYAWRILDLAEHPAPGEAETRKVEVSAAFNGAGEARPRHYQIRLAAFSQKPGEVRRIWNDEPVLFDTVLQQVGRNVRVGADDPGWQTVQASMEIPPGTRSLLISLAASEADSASAPREYYLDDAQVRLVASSVSN